MREITIVTTKFTNAITTITSVSYGKSVGKFKWQFTTVTIKLTIAIETVTSVSYGKSVGKFR